jgi:YfiH family protein
VIAHNAGSLRYYTFSSFDWPWLVHGVFGRRGGVSSGHWSSLNMSISVGDSRENVRANRERAFQALSRDPHSVADTWQVHSADVLIAEAPRDLSTDAPRADALVTDRPTVSLFQRFADCVPILLVDPKRRAVGIAHAGWRGTLNGVAAATVRALTERYGSQPADLFAGIGPSIGPERYEVGPEVVAQTRAVFNGQSERVLISRKGRWHLDLWAANELLLRAAGVGQIEVSGLCTASHTGEFFSHRGERGQTGRFGALIALS